MEDKFALTEKILQDIDTVMCKNDDICVFDIVPVEKNTINKSPVIYSENCMGLESWCVKYVYMNCYSELLEKKYLFMDKNMTPDCYKRLTKLLNVILLLNPDLSSFWNQRRKLFIKKKLSRQKELQFSKLVLSRKPKCNEAFAYRRWIINGLIKDSIFHSELLNTVNEELDLCTLTAERNPNNYHSWSHRIWLLKKLINKDILHRLLIKEYAFSKKWASTHVSDFSCYHYRQFCVLNVGLLSADRWIMFEDTLKIRFHNMFIRFLIENFTKDTMKNTEEKIKTTPEENMLAILFDRPLRNCRCIPDQKYTCKQFQLLFYELVWNEDLIKYYHHHESLWYHRRFIVHEILLLMYNYFNLTYRNDVLVFDLCNKCSNDNIKTQAKVVRYDNNNLYSSILFIVFVSYEKKFIDNRKHANDSYVDSHEKYLKFVEHLSDFL